VAVEAKGIKYKTFMKLIKE